MVEDLLNPQKPLIRRVSLILIYLIINIHVVVKHFLEVEKHACVHV